MPPGLEELGPAQAIRGRMKSLAAESGIEMTLEGDLPRLDDWVEQALYGMTTEALTNAVRHSHARTVSVELRVARDRAVVIVQDDGQGFDPGRGGAPPCRRRPRPARNCTPVALARRVGLGPKPHRLGHPGQDIDPNCPTRGHTGGLPCHRQRCCPSGRNGEGKS